jgi:hypothetical protein
MEDTCKSNSSGEKWPTACPRIIIIIITPVIHFMQGIYSYAPETNHVPSVRSCSVFTICATCNVISPMKYVLYFYIWGPLMVAQWLRHCTTNRKDAGSIPDGVIGIFH